MQTNQLLQHAMSDLSDLKALDVKSINVGQNSFLTDFMIIATGTSSRHVAAIADKLIRNMKSRSIKPFGIERDPLSTWILVDFGDIVIHIFQAETRLFYQLEKLWEHASSETPKVSKSLKVPKVQKEKIV